MVTLLLASVLLPLALVPLGAHRATAAIAAAALPWAPLPALAYALLGPDGMQAYPEILLGTVIAFGDTERLLLLVITLVWICVGLHLRCTGYRGNGAAGRRFLVCYALALTGNLGLVVVQDWPGFYLFFSMMSLASYGLIATDARAESRHAARVYLVYALIGEALILGGFLVLATDGAPAVAALLLYFGLGTKHAVLPMHSWLPLAHGSAAVPASALLSAVLLKAGIIGWLRYFPSVQPALAEVSSLIIYAGAFAAVAAALVGCSQRKEKMVLAYSSVSQMGLLTLAFGIALSSAAAWAALLPFLLLFIAHHALIKAALFLGVGISRERIGNRWTIIVMSLLAAALAGAPLTMGATIKLGLDTWAYTLPDSVQQALTGLLPLTSVTTSLVMLRFLWLMRRAPARGTGSLRALAPPWPFLLQSALALSLPWWLGVFLGLESIWAVASLDAVWKTAWPVLLGLALALLAWHRPIKIFVPPGDIVIILERCLSASTRLRLPPLQRPQLQWPPTPWAAYENLFRRLPVVGIVYVACLLVLGLLASVWL